MENYRPSIVEYFSEQRREGCGYCSSKIGSNSYGLHAHILNVEDYQNMIDRGWRRCGHYCYKSIMKTTCCPLYTIRCSVKDIRVSKSQKKILKRFNQYLIAGIESKDKHYTKTEIVQPIEIHFASNNNTASDINLKVVKTTNVINQEETNAECSKNVDFEKVKERIEKTEDSNGGKTIKNACQKAKYLRVERKRLKLQKQGFSDEEIAKKLIEKKRYPIVKKLEDYLNEPTTKDQLSHKLKVSLVRSCPRSEEFNNTFPIAYELYKKYQISIHKDRPEKITKNQFEKFLVDSPLQATGSYGSYHQQYWLDSKLIAVGVLDILPRCVSSVYFFYDPDYSHLSLGTYGALREIELTRSLANRMPGLNFYCLGFYIHTCVKMKYKAAFKPSFLLCPEAYTWHPMEECLPKLNKAKYTRFNEDATVIESISNVSFSDIRLLYNGTAMTFLYFINEVRLRQEEINEVMEYAQLVGKLCTRKILLFRK